MFIGHHAAALVGRLDATATPLWLFVLAAQLLDFIWAILVITGLEVVAADPVIGLAFLSHPYSHSLAAAVGWALVAAFVARRALDIPLRDAVILALVVASHWPLDLIVHRADLPLWPGGEARLGYALWDYPTLELGVETVLFVVTGLALWRFVRSDRLAKGRLLGFVVFGPVLMIVLNGAPPPAEIDPVALGATFLAIHLLFVFLAWLIEPRGGSYSRT